MQVVWQVQRIPRRGIRYRVSHVGSGDSPSQGTVLRFAEYVAGAVSAGFGQGKAYLLFLREGSVNLQAPFRQTLVL